MPRCSPVPGDPHVYPQGGRNSWRGAAAFWYRSAVESLQLQLCGHSKHRGRGYGACHGAAPAHFVQQCAGSVLERKVRDKLTAECAIRKWPDMCAAAGTGTFHRTGHSVLAGIFCARHLHPPARRCAMHIKIKNKKAASIDTEVFFWCDREDSASRALKTVRWTGFTPRDAGAQHGLFESAWYMLICKQKTVPLFQGMPFGATGRIRTSGLPGQGTTTGQYRPTIKRKFCWPCTVAPETRKSPLLVGLTVIRN